MTAPTDLPGTSVPVLTLPEALAPAPALSKRDRLMAALSVAERLTAESPVDPTSVRIGGNAAWGLVPGEPECVIGVELHFDASEAVAEFAAGVSATVAVRDRGEQSYLEASGVLDGVPFCAWAVRS